MAIPSLDSLAGLWNSASRGATSWPVLSVIVAAVAVIRHIHRIPEKYRPILIGAVLLMDSGYFNVRGIQYEADWNYELADSTVATIAQGRFIDGDTGFRADQVRYSRYVAAAIRAESRMVGTNEGGVLPAGCEAVFEGLEQNPDVLLRLAACQIVVKRSGLQQPLPKEALPRVWFCPAELQHYLQRPISAIAETDVDALILAAKETPVTVLLDETQQLIAEVNTKRKGTFVVADTWYPEWKASLDGVDCGIQRVFHCFRGIPVEPGHHTIELRYQPMRFWISLWVSVAAMIVVFVILVMDFRRHEVPGKLCLQFRPSES